MILATLMVSVDVDPAAYRGLACHRRRNHRSRRMAILDGFSEGSNSEGGGAADLVVIGQGMLPGDVAHTYDPGTVIFGGATRLVAHRRLMALIFHAPWSHGRTPVKHPERFAKQSRYFSKPKTPPLL